MVADTYRFRVEPITAEVPRLRAGSNPGLPALMLRSHLALHAGSYQTPGFGDMPRGTGVSHVPVRVDCLAELALAGSLLA